jgi:hypothetical protein
MADYYLYEEQYFMDNGIVLSELGSDSVVIENKDTQDIYICGHFKEFKIKKAIQDVYVLNNPKIIEGQDMKFIDQMVVLNKILNLFSDKECFIMCDANTQVVQGTETNILRFYEKEGKMTSNGFNINGLDFFFEYPVYVVNKTMEDMLSSNTSFKMRATHTAQINKSFIESMCNIDYIIYKPKQGIKYEMNSTIYGLDENGNLKIKLPQELTTSPVSISDHAPVITFVNDNKCLGTFNIKGGNTEDTTWAEFLVEDYKNFFLDEIVQERIQKLLLLAFEPCPHLEGLSNEEKLRKIQSKNFVSEERFSICEVHLPCHFVPKVINNDKNIYICIWDHFQKIYTIQFYYTDNIKERYIYSHDTYWDADEEKIVRPQIVNWINILLKDLNQYNSKQSEEWNLENENKRIKYFQEKIVYLLNFYQMVQQDTLTIVNDKSLYDVYSSWYFKNKSKVSIKEMLIQLKKLNPLLSVVALQEYPIEQELMAKLTTELSEIGKVYLNETPFIINKKQSATRGAIFVYEI